MTDVDTILKLWPILTVAGAVLMAALFWHLSKRFVKREEHEAMQAEIKSLQISVDGIGGKLTSLQGRLDNLPTAGEVNKILLGLEELRGAQREMTATIKGQADVLKRIEHPVQLMMAEAIKKGNKRDG